MTITASNHRGWLHIGWRRPRGTLMAAALLLLVLIAGTRELTFDPAYDTFFDPDAPQLLDYEHLRDVFTPSDALVFVVQPGDDELFDVDDLAMLEALTEAAWRLPFAARVESLSNYPHSTAQGDDVSIQPLFEDAEALSQAEIARIEAVARSRPELRGRLVEADGPLAAVVVTILADGPALEVSNTLMSAARELIAELHSVHPETRIHLGGIVAMNHAFSESSQQDAMRLLPVMLAVMALLLWLILRSWALVGMIGALMLATIAAALGAGGWLGIALTTPSAIAPFVIITICVADGVHIGIGYLRAAAAGAPREQAIAASLQDNGLPVVLTTLTTAAGFLSMNASSVPPFRDLGNLAAGGAVLAGALSLWVLPALLQVWPHRPHSPRLGDAFGAWLAGWIGRHRRRLLWGCGLLALVLTPGFARLHVNDDFVAYFDAQLPFRQGAELVDGRLLGPHVIDYQLRARTGASGIHEPAFLADVAAFTTWLRDRPEVVYVASWTDVLERLHEVLRPQAPGPLPKSSEAAAQYTLLYELSLPLGLDVTNMIDADYASVRTSVGLRDMDAVALIAFEERVTQWLATHTDTLDVRYGGINLMFAHITERNVSAMARGNVLAVAVIGLLLMVTLRSVALGALSLAANLLPIVLAFAVWGWLGGSVGLALSTIFGMTLGIVVDDTVHLLTRYARGRRAGLPARSAMRTSIEQLAPALVVTTLILAGGFLVLAASGFALNARMALITALTIGFALFVVLIALPALLWGREPDDLAGELR